VVQIAKALPHSHLPTVAVSVVVVSLLLVLRRFAPKLPAALIVVVGAIAASMIWHFSDRGIAVIGPVVGGLPHLGFRAVRWNDLPMLLTIAASCAIMIITQSAATARAYGSHDTGPMDENADLAGLSAANAMAGLSGTFVVNGSPTQTAMAVSVGAQSQFAQLVTAGTVAVVLLFLTKPLEYLPRCVLGALVFLIATQLIRPRTLLGIRRESPGEYALALTTAIVVVTVGVEQGILLAMILSLVRIVRHSYHPHTGVMSAASDGSWRLTPVAAGAVTEPGLVLYRFGATLFYANANLFADEIQCLTGDPPSRVRWLIVDAEAITRLDYSAARVLRQLASDLKDRDVAFGFARMPWDLKADFQRHHVMDVISPGMIFNRLHDALDGYQKLVSE
jgi:MFS superfamily sulfate permease-like transporter